MPEARGLPGDGPRLLCSHHSCWGPAGRSPACRAPPPRWLRGREYARASVPRAASWENGGCPGAACAAMTGSNPARGALGRGQRPRSRCGPRRVARPAAGPSPYHLATPTRAPLLDRRERLRRPIGRRGGTGHAPQLRARTAVAGSRRREFRGRGPVPWVGLSALARRGPGVAPVSPSVNQARCPT